MEDKYKKPIIKKCEFKYNSEKPKKFEFKYEKPEMNIKKIPKKDWNKEKKEFEIKE